MVWQAFRPLLRREWIPAGIPDVRADLYVRVQKERGFRMMRKMLAAVLLMSLWCAASSYAADMGVQLIEIGPSDEEGVQIVSQADGSAEDIRLNSAVDLPGFASVTATGFAFQDGLGFYREGETCVYYEDDYIWSGKDAEYAVLSVDILNTSKNAADFLKDCEVTVSYDDTYTWTGFGRQRNYNNEVYDGGPVSADLGMQNTNWAIDVADQFEIGVMYKGHYFFVAAVPNAAAFGKAPLSMTVNLAGNEFTYIIREGEPGADVLQDARVELNGSEAAANASSDPGDLKPKAAAELSDWGLISCERAVFQDSLGYYREGEREVYDSYGDYYQSQVEAEFALVYISILNLKNTPVNFQDTCEVKVVYNDEYEFKGWCYQRNYDNAVYDDAPVPGDKGNQNQNWVINEADNFPIQPLFAGHYILGCTLPNAVVEGKEPLQLIAKIRGEEIVYNIR